MPVGEVKNLVNKLEVEVGSASLSIVFHLVSKWNSFFFSGARQGRHPEGGSVRSPPPPRPPRLHQHRPHTLVALHCPPWPGQLLLHFTLFWKPTRDANDSTLFYQSGGGPLTFVPGGLKIEGSTQVIFFRTLMPPHACYPQHGCHKRLLATWWQTSWPLGPEGSPCVETGTSDDLKCKQQISSYCRTIKLWYCPTARLC